MSAAHTPGPMKTSDALWFALIALGKEGGNMDGGKYRTEWLQVRDAMERAKAAEKAEAAAPRLAEALLELLAAGEHSVTAEDDVEAMLRFGEATDAARAALVAAGLKPPTRKDSR